MHRKFHLKSSAIDGDDELNCANPEEDDENIDNSSHLPIARGLDCLYIFATLPKYKAWGNQKGNYFTG